MKKIFQTTIRNLLGIISINITFSNEFILCHRPKEEKIDPYNLKLMLIPTISESP